MKTCNICNKHNLKVFENHLNSFSHINNSSKYILEYTNILSKYLNEENLINIYSYLPKIYTLEAIEGGNKPRFITTESINKYINLYEHYGINIVDKIDLYHNKCSKCKVYGIKFYIISELGNENEIENLYYICPKCYTTGKSCSYFCNRNHKLIFKINGKLINNNKCEFCGATWCNLWSSHGGCNIDGTGFRDGGVNECYCDNCSHFVACLSCYDENGSSYNEDIDEWLCKKCQISKGFENDKSKDDSDNDDSDNDMSKNKINLKIVRKRILLEPL